MVTQASPVLPFFSIVFTHFLSLGSFLVIFIIFHFFFNIIFVMVNCNQWFSMSLLWLTKDSDQIANIHWIIKKQESFRKTSTSLLYWLHQSLWLCGSQQTVENSERDGNTRPPTGLLRNLYAGQEATVRTEHGATDWFQTGKEYFKAVFCHLAYLTYMQSTSREMLGWMKHKLESRLPGEISIISNMQMTPPLWQKVKRN